MSAGRPALPEYAHPPLVAATLAVAFREHIDTAPALLAAYQQSLGPEWAGRWVEISDDVDHDTFAGYLPAGWQLHNMLDDRVIRVSPKHFEFTWLGMADTRYPRYENVRDGFVAAWDAWSERRTRTPHDLGWWAVAYLNRIRQGTVWQVPSDGTFFRLLPDPRLSERLRSARWFLKTPGTVDPLQIDWSFPSPAPDINDASIWLRLTARGEIGRESSALLDGMDAGRAAIVQTFSDLLSPAANAYWGLRRREK